MRRILILMFALGGSALAAPVSAQSSSAARGLPWVGCWQAMDGVPTQVRVCVIPEREHDLRIVSFDAEGKPTESTLHLNGARTDVSTGTCKGWEQARLSTDGDRILVDAELTCGSAPQLRRATAFVITPAGYWLQVNGSGVAMIANANVRLYRPVDTYAGFPDEIGAAVAPFVQEAERERLAVRGEAVSAGDLLELESLNVATPVIDLVVAASYPKVFAIDAQGDLSNAQGATSAVSDAQRDMYGAWNQFQLSNGFPMLSYYDLARYSSCARMGVYGCSSLGYYGYSPFGYGYGNPYYGGYWPGYGVPVVVRPVTPAPGSGAGRVVRGQGYTSGTNAGSPRSATPRTGTAATTRSGGASGSASSGSAGSGSSAGSSGSSGGSERTAKPRSP